MDMNDKKFYAELKKSIKNLAPSSIYDNERSEKFRRLYYDENYFVPEWPIYLMTPVFENFLENCNEISLEKKDEIFTINLIKELKASIHKEEKFVVSKFQQIFENYLFQMNKNDFVQLGAIKIGDYQT